MIELQRSQWANEYYVNFGVFHHPDGQRPSRLRFVDAQVGGRIQALHPKRSPSQLSAALNLENSSMSDDARAATIERWLDLSLPAIEELRDPGELRSHPRRVDRLRSNGIFCVVD
jgi:hypothetical protein